MELLQQQQTKALDLIVTDYKEKKDAYAAVPPLVEVFEELIVIRDDVDERTKQQLKNTTGITKTKTEAKNALGSSAYIVAAGISAWAEKNQDSTVLGQVNFTELGLQNTNDKLIVPTCKNIYELAEKHLAELLPLGVVDADNMQQMTADMDVYSKLLAVPRQLVLDRAEETKQIKLLLKKALSILKKRGDKLVIKLKKKDIATYNSYMAARPWPRASKKDVPPTPPPSV